MYHAKHYSYQISRYCSNNQTAITAYQKGITDEQIQAEEPATEAQEGGGEEDELPF